MLAITNATVLSPLKVKGDSTLIITEGKISHVGPADRPIPEGIQVIDAHGKLVVPGFIDLQINGAFGNDFTANPETIWETAGELPRYGVTVFLPTIVTSPLTKIDAARDLITFGQPQEFEGAWPLGLHLEGPFLNPAKKGAHARQFMRNPLIEDVVDWSPATGVRMVTLAPELPGAAWICSVLADRGILISAGHSMASYNEAKSGIDAGIRYGTHLFNAMPEFHHREPGLAGAVLADERVTAGLIVDGLHVHPGIIKVVWQITRDGRLNLVTDAIAALGMPDGDYQLGKLTVTVKGESCRLPDGTLAGSTLSLDKGLKNLIKYTGCSLPEALRTITATPAALLGLGHQKGQIAEGYDADIVLLNSDHSVDKTIVAGKILFAR